MRKEIYRMPDAEARALLASAPYVHLCGTDDDGRPIARTVHGVVVDGALAFHAAPAGEKLGLLDRPVVAFTEEMVAEIPSWFVDPERACPATTYYRAVQVHGVLETVSEPAHKARVLAALMARFQPEGRHVPITHDHPLYEKALRGLLVAHVPLAHLDGKSKLGQNRSAEERARILELLWQRGRPGDPRAIELIRRASPDTPLPPFLAAPAGLRLSVCLGPGDLDGALALLRGAYWNVGNSDEALRRSHLGADAWVGAHDAEGRLVATARATSDGAKHAWVYDVAVHPAQRGLGVGQAVVRLLCDHPAVRAAHLTHLYTRDAQAFYGRLGFAPPRPPPFERTELVLERAEGAPAAGPIPPSPP